MSVDNTLALASIWNRRTFSETEADDVGMALASGTLRGVFLALLTGRGGHYAARHVDRKPLRAPNKPSARSAHAPMTSQFAPAATRSPPADQLQKLAQRVPPDL